MLRFVLLLERVSENYYFYQVEFEPSTVAITVNCDLLFFEQNVHSRKFKTLIFLTDENGT